MASVNRFALLDDDAPVVVAKVAVVEAPAPAAPQNNGDRSAREGGRGRGRGRGGRGAGPASHDRPYRPHSAVDGPRLDGESNPNKREFDHHHSRTDYVRGGGRGRGGRGGGQRQPWREGAALDVAPEQTAEQAIDSLPAADGETPVAEAPVEEVAAVEEPVEEEDKTITLAQFLANKTSKLDADLALRVREAGEDVVEDDFQSTKAVDKEDITASVLGAAARDAAKKEAGSSGPKMVEKKKNTVESDFFFAAPGARGGRGGARGGPRGGARGGYSARGPAAVNVNDNRAFPTLGK